MKCYVYAIVVDGVVRYIGKGTGWRVRQHFAIARRLTVVRASGHKVKASYFHNKLSKSLLAGADVTSLILRDGMSDAEAYAEECRQIEAHDGLWNRWVGVGGRVQASQELKEKLSAAARARYRDPEQLRQVTARLRRLAADPKFRSAASERQKARFAAGDASMRLWHDRAHCPESYAKRGATLKKTLASRPDLRNKVAEWRKTHMTDHAASLKAAHARPEVKEKRRAYYDSPEGLANLKRAALAAKAKRAETKAVRP